jgi:hypothetical protein
VPVALRLTPFWVGLLLGSLLLAREAWSAFRESLEAQATTTTNTSDARMFRAAKTKAWVLGSHLLVIGLLFVQWVIVLAGVAGTKGVTAQPLGIG